LRNPGADLALTPMGMVVFSPDGRLAAVAGASGRVQVLSVADGNVARSVQLPSATGIVSLDVSNDGRLVAAPSDGPACLWGDARGSSVPVGTSVKPGRSAPTAARS